MTKSMAPHPNEKSLALSGFSGDDIQRAKEFHGPILGLEAKRDV